MKKRILLLAAVLSVLFLITGLSGPAKAETAEVGDTIIFGHFEQDNNTKNGKEPIEWLVLDLKDGKALLISRYALFARPYDKKSGQSALLKLRWGNCGLRTWLNKDFLKAAFSKKEQKAIVKTKVDNSEAQSSLREEYYQAKDSKTTTDQVFCLSFREVEELFPDDESRKCVPTEYALAQGLWTDERYQVDGRNTCEWWLRSLVGSSPTAMPGTVYTGGFISCSYQSEGNDGVRPALWLNLSKAEYELVKFQVDEEKIRQEEEAVRLKAEQEAAKEAETQAEIDAVRTPEDPTTVDVAFPAKTLTFTFDQEKDFYELTYRFPSVMNLEVETDKKRNTLRYFGDGSDAAVFAVVMARKTGITPDERVAELCKGQKLTETVINGIRWVRGTAGANGSKAFLYGCQVGEATFTISFNTNFPDSYLPENFGEVFLAQVRAR